MEGSPRRNDSDGTRPRYYQRESDKVFRLLPMHRSPRSSAIREAGFLSMIIPAAMIFATRRFAFRALSFLPFPWRRRGGGFLSLLRLPAILALGLIVFSPQTLRSAMPNWESSLGILLLVVCVSSFFHAAIHSFSTVLRASFWLIACVIISRAVYHPAPDRRYESTSFEALNLDDVDHMFVRARNTSDSWFGGFGESLNNAVGSVRGAAASEAR